MYSVGKRITLVAVALSVVLVGSGFTPNKDTAPSRQDKILGTDELSTGQGRTSQTMETRPPMTTSPQSPEVAVPFAYPDIKLDGQEFFPKKTPSGQPPIIYQPNQRGGGR